MKAQADKLNHITRHSRQHPFFQNKEEAKPFFSKHRIQPKLTIGQPNDKYEQEADLMTGFVVNRGNAPTSKSSAAPKIQKKCATCEAENKAVLPKLQKMEEEESEKTGMAQSQIQRMEKRDYPEGFVDDEDQMSQLPIQMKREGGDGPRQSLKTELLQGNAVEMIQAKKKERKKDVCKGFPKKYIKKVVVEQETPQFVTIHWSDKSIERDECSTGKGQCCVDPSDIDGVACSVSKSRRGGTSCTPIGTRTVDYQTVETGGGVRYWTSFQAKRGIALHEYFPVDGTPLSHGCVRLHEPIAKKIFCGSRIGRTRVQVRGYARPKCDHSNLKLEWLGDFRTASKPIDGDKMNSREIRNIRNTRKGLRRAFGGIKDTVLTEKLDELSGKTDSLSIATPAKTANSIKEVAAAIPRCTSSGSLASYFRMLKSIKDQDDMMTKALKSMSDAQYEGMFGEISKRNKKKNLRFIQLIEIMRSSGMTMSELSAEQKKYLEGRARAAGKSVGEYIKDDASKHGYGGSVATWWPSLTPDQQKNWKKRFRIVLRKIKRKAPREVRKIIRSAERKGGGIKFQPDKIEEASTLTFTVFALNSKGNLIVGKDWLQAAEANMEDVYNNIVHELGGHYEFGDTLSYDIFKETLSSLPAPERAKANSSTRSLYSIYGYMETELYAELRELPYRTPTSKGDKPEKDVETQLKKIKHAFGAKIGTALVKGFRRRIQNDDKISTAARSLYDTKAEKVFGITF